MGYRINNTAPKTASKKFSYEDAGNVSGENSVGHEEITSNFVVTCLKQKENSSKVIYDAGCNVISKIPHYPYRQCSTLTNNNIQHYHKTYLDHVYAVSDTDGDLIEHYRYSAFGEIEVYSPSGTKLADSAIDNTVTWNSRRYDFETGLYYYKYRHYKSDIGRWLGRDPIGEIGGYNLYGFILNRPFNSFDVFGLQGGVLRDVDVQTKRLVGGVGNIRTKWTLENCKGKYVGNSSETCYKCFCDIVATKVGIRYDYILTTTTKTFVDPAIWDAFLRWQAIHEQLIADLRAANAQATYHAQQNDYYTGIAIAAQGLAIRCAFTGNIPCVAAAETASIAAAGTAYYHSSQATAYNDLASELGVQVAEHLANKPPMPTDGVYTEITATTSPAYREVTLGRTVITNRDMGAGDCSVVQNSPPWNQ